MQWASSQLHQEERKRLEDLIRIDCPVEPQFKELFAVLGNKEEQDKIRAGSKQSKGLAKFNHCKMLRSRPDACVRFPVAGGKFEICKQNPHHPDKAKAREEAKARLEEVRPLSISDEQEKLLKATASQAYWDVDLGVASLSTLSPVKYILACAKKNEIEIERIQNQARLIGDYVGARVAEILSHVMGVGNSTPVAGKRRGRRSRV